MTMAVGTERVWQPKNGKPWTCVAHGVVKCSYCKQIKTPWQESKERGREMVEESRARRALAQANAPAPTGYHPTHRERFSQATEDGSCPNCGGTQFTAKRSKKGKVGLGIIVLPLAAFAPKTMVKCVTCGTMFKRG